MTPPKERIFRNAVAAIAGQVASDGSQMLAALIQMRALEQAGWGLFGFLLSSLDVVRVLTDAGLHVVGIRHLAVGTRPPRDVLRHVLLLKTLLAMTGLLVIAGLSVGVSDFWAHRGLFLALGATLFPFAYAAGLVLRFQAEHRMERLIAPKAFVGGLYLVAVWAGATWHLGVAGYVAIYIAYQFALWIATIAASRRTFPAAADAAVFRRPDWPFAGAIARQASAVGLLMLFVIAYSRLGVVFLARLGSLEAVGQYYTALKLTEPLLALAGALSVSAYPVLSRLVHSNNSEEAGRRFMGYSLKSAAFSCGVAGLLTLFGRDLLAWIRPEYAAAAGPLSALAWATVFMFQNQLSTALINAFEKFHYVTAISAVNLVVFLILSYLLLPRFGATGAALSLLGTEAGNAVMQIIAASALLARAASRPQGDGLLTTEPQPARH